jgi:hypothetical protein
MLKSLDLSLLSDAKFSKPKVNKLVVENILNS